MLTTAVKRLIPAPIMRAAKRILGRDRYDRPTRAIMRACLQTSSNAVDVGANRGDILESILKHAPHGKHMAFEPLPDFAGKLRSQFPHVDIHEIALSDEAGYIEFCRVEGHEDYSGFLRRELPNENWNTRPIRVQRARLDTLWPKDRQLDFMKIDVEGAELQVLRGALPLLARWHPVVVFEHGLGASDVYGTTAEDVFDLLGSCGLNIWLLDRWLASQTPLSRDEFHEQRERRLNYYFVAGPLKS